MEHAVPLFGADLVVFEPLIAELPFNTLAELFVMVGELVRIPTFCR
jgi:hypothetical protein